MLLIYVFISVTPTNEDRSQQCVSDFLDKYVLESDTDSEGQKIPVLKKKPTDNTGTESPESATLTEGKSLMDTKSVSEGKSLSDGSGQTLKAKKIQTRLFLFVSYLYNKKKIHYIFFIDL